MCTDGSAERCFNVECRDFESLGIDKEFARVLRSLGYVKPTTIQCLAIPRILGTSKNVLISAPTGTGKTEAALIPILYIVKRTYRNIKPIAILYVTPLRALNRDITQRISRLASSFGLTVDLWHGDTPSSRRRHIIHSPPHILVTTPESLSIILTRSELRKHLTNLLFVVIDEAQEVYESERGTELAILILRIKRLTASNPRIILISSPIHNPRELVEFLTSSKDAVIVEGEHAKEYDVRVDTLDPSTEIRTLSDALYCLPKLVRILKSVEQVEKQVLVFVNTRVAAEELGHILAKKLGIEGSLVHHGSLSKELRESVEDLFKRGILRHLVATSSLELGIDVGGIDLVIQVMSPRQAIRLIQRVGRAGHREQEVSRGIVLVPPMISEVLEATVIAKKVLNRELERQRLHANALDVLAHQIIGLCLEGLCNPTDIYNFITRATPYKHLSRELFDEVLKLLHEANLIKLNGERIEVTRAGEIYHKTTTMIVDTKKYIAKSIIDHRVIATLDDEFIVTCQEGDVIVLGGRLWRIASIDYDREEIFLEPLELSAAESKIPRWVGENIPVSYEVSQECCSLIEKLCGCNDDLCIESILAEYPVTDSVKRLILSNIKQVCKVFPKHDRITIEIVDTTPQYILIYACLGTKGSEALAILLSTLMKRELGIQASYKAHQIATVIVPSRKLGKDELAGLLSHLLKLSPDQLKDLLIQGLSEIPLFKLYLVRVAKKFGLISRDVSLREVYKLAEAYRNVKPLVYEAMRELLVEKLDLTALNEFLQRLRSSRKIVVYTTKRPSALAREILSLITPLGTYDALPSHTIIELVKKRILNKTTYFLCLNCLYRWSHQLNYLVTKYIATDRAIDLATVTISCPACGSRLIAAFSSMEDRDDAYRILLKLRRGQTLSPDDQKALQRIKKCAEVVMNYGLAAVIALQGTGVGPDSARRILSRLLEKSSRIDLDELVRAVLEQERKFLSTRQYWH